MKNKKADMNVMIIVFMSLVVFLSMLFIFVTSQKQVIKSLASPEVIEAAYSEQAKVTFYVNDLAEKAMAGLDKKDILFKEKFTENFKQELNSNQDILFLKDLKEKADKIPSEIEFTFNKDNIEILVKDYTIGQEEESLTDDTSTDIDIELRQTEPKSYKITYAPDIKVVIPL